MKESRGRFKFSGRKVSLSQYLLTVILFLILFSANSLEIIQLRETLNGQPSGSFYTGNPYPSRIKPGEAQFENLTWMHGYVYIDGVLYNRTDLLANPTDTASYIVESDGTEAWMTNCSTGQRDWTDPSNMSVLQAAVGNLTSGGILFIKLPFKASGTLELTAGKVTITTGVKFGGITEADDQNYIIQNIHLDISTAHAEDITLEGLALRGLHFDTQGYHARGITVKDCLFIRLTNSDMGIVTEGDGAATGYTEHVTFEGCWFRTSTYASLNDGSTKGFFTWTNAKGQTSWHFIGCRFNLSATDTTLFFFDTVTSVIGLTFDGCFLYTSSEKTGQVIMYVKGNSAAMKGTAPIVSWFGGHQEIHSACKWYYMEAGSQNSQRLHFVMIGSSLGASGGNIIMFDIQHVAGWSADQLLVFAYNRVNLATFSIGTLPSDANVRKEINHNQGFITENEVSFSSISNGTYVAHGVAGDPENNVLITLSVQGYAWYGSTNSTHVQVYGSVSTLSGHLYCNYAP